MSLFSVCKICLKKNTITFIWHFIKIIFIQFFQIVSIFTVICLQMMNQTVNCRKSSVFFTFVAKIFTFSLSMLFPIMIMQAFFGFEISLAFPAPIRGRFYTRYRHHHQILSYFEKKKTPYIILKDIKVT